MRVRLTVESGLASPRVTELDDTTVATLGRNRDSTIVLQDRHASRRHARLTSIKGSWHISDLETTNGTRVDGTPVVGAIPLHDGQVISVGDVRVRFGARVAEEADEPHLINAPPEGESCDTVFQADELTALFRFMNSSLAEATPHGLVTLALQTALRQTLADMAGFLSLDGDNPELRLVQPAQAPFDRHLSQHLTQKVLREGRSFWLCAPGACDVDSDSLSDFHDAVCVPLLASPPPGASSVEAPLARCMFIRRPDHSRIDRFASSRCWRAAWPPRCMSSVPAVLSRPTTPDFASMPPLATIWSAPAPPMAQLRQQIRRLADGPCTVLIFGESGVGKELVALGLHRQSSRHRGPLVTVNCAAISGTMAESELFGHMRGAFTGATRDHPGFFAQADMGTLFLDELGELSLDLQAKLLRAIETKSFRPVGARAEVRADVRIIVATNRDLEQEVREGRFRRDLYFRLTSRIVVPALRDHLEDVPELVQHFLEHLTSEYRKRVSLSEAALERMLSYNWPGNVRQLRSILEGAVALASENGTINASDLHLADSLSSVVPDRPVSLNLEDVELWAIRHALTETNHNNTHAARVLGIHRETLINKLKKYRIERPEG